jgi:phage terminase large subunit-like protein
VVERSKYTPRVQNIIDFIELLIVPSGNGQGSTFKLMDFQKEFISDVYGPVDEKGKRIVRRAILSMGRKNGKTMMVACLSLVHLWGPEKVMNGENYSVANDRDQASIVFRYACQIVRADPELSAAIQITESTKTMIAMDTGSVYRAVSSEAGTKMGLSPSFVSYDELAQSKNRELYDAFDTAMGARYEPLFITISTQSPDPQHPLSILIDQGLSKQIPSTYCKLYAVPDDAEGIFDNIEVWKLANPALGVFRSLDDIVEMAKRAKQMPSFESSYRNLNLNQRIDAKSPLIPRAEWIGCRGEDGAADIISGEDIILGLDLSGKTDLTALIGVSSGESDKVKSWFWIPKDTLDEHEKRDRVTYALWERQGHIKTTPGKSIQYSFIAQEIAEISKVYNIIGIAFDRYRIDDLRNAMDGIGLNSYIEKKDPKGNPIVEPSGGIRMVPWGQGYASMTGAVEALEGSILDRVLVHDGHPCLTWNISNAMVISDAAGNRKLDKSQVRFRIDGAVALAMAVGLKSRDRKGLPQPSSYTGRTAEEMIADMAFK